jgi:hypothetical protein
MRLWVWEREMDAVGVDRQQQRSDETCPRNNGTTTNSWTNFPHNNQQHHQRPTQQPTAPPTASPPQTQNRTCVDSPCVVPTATTVRGVEVERPSVCFV